MEPVKHNSRRYHFLSTLLEYPQEGFDNRVNEIQLYLEGSHPHQASLLEDFTLYVSSVSLDEIQQLHTRTFDVQAVTTLDLGYLLFGDDYKRAQLLVNLSREHSAAGNSCGLELADHLPSVLRLLSLMDDGELKEHMVHKLLRPGLRKMIAEFDTANIEKKNELYRRHHKTIIEFPSPAGALYQKPLQVVHTLLEEDFRTDEKGEEKTAGFLRPLSDEMNIED